MDSTNETVVVNRLKVVHAWLSKRTKFRGVIAIVMAIGIVWQIAGPHIGHQRQFTADEALAVQQCSANPLESAQALLRHAGAEIDDDANTIYGGLKSRVIRAYLPATALNAPQIAQSMPYLGEVEKCGGGVVVSGWPLGAQLPAGTLLDSHPDSHATGKAVTTIAIVIPRAQVEKEGGV